MDHFSARVPGTDEIIIKPRDVGWNKVTPDDLITYTLDYQKLSGARARAAHGPVIVGRSVEEACMLTISLETASKSQIIASMVGGKRSPIDGLGLTPRSPSANLWKALLNSY
jgi:ribulose-5-phosphate 4-epimerase/fuculose-1-phosphate aldolase